MAIVISDYDLRWVPKLLFCSQQFSRFRVRVRVRGVRVRVWTKSGLVVDNSALNDPLNSLLILNFVIRLR